MNRRNIYLFLFFLIMLAPASGCFVYSEKSFKGTVLDIDTKQPIEGAVVVAEYKKAYVSLGAGQVDYTMDVRETLTDKDGNFHFPSHVALSSPISTQIPTIFIIFKPGYASLGHLQLESQYFMGEEISEKEGSLVWAKELKYRIHGRGIVELPKVKTKEERWKADMVTIDPDFRDRTPILNRLIEEEDKALGVK